jgi:hypothetical protein
LTGYSRNPVRAYVQLPPGFDYTTAQTYYDGLWGAGMWPPEGYPGMAGLGADASTDLSNLPPLEVPNPPPLCPAGFTCDASGNVTGVNPATAVPQAPIVFPCPTGFTCNPTTGAIITGPTPPVSAGTQTTLMITASIVGVLLLLMIARR